MEAVNGVKIFQCGEDDTFYAETAKEAEKEFREMIGEEEADEILCDGPVEELTQKEFENGQLHFDKTGQYEMDDAPVTPYREALEHLTKDGSKLGHFSTTHW